MKSLKKSFFFIFIIQVLLISTARSEVDPDIELLPVYCKVRKAGNTHPEYKKWAKVMGNDFIHIHHYCDGLALQIKANRTINIKKKQQFLQQALGEINYTLRYSSKNFILKPKIFYDIGKIYEELDKSAEAMNAYRQSILLNPKVSLPYVALSDLYLKQNNKNEAVSILKKGLKYKPDSIQLKSRLEKIIGRR